jgi:N2-(2-carboxyethyl)arginine synthase
MTRSSIAHAFSDAAPALLAWPCPQPMRAKLATVLLLELRRRGIKRVFGVPGRENANILFNEAPGVEFVTTRVEFTAGIMAEMTGRLTRKPQVCFSTMGPGATNMATAAAACRLNHSPVIFISAQIESDDCYYNLSHQCVDQSTMMSSLTKWSYQLQSPRELPAVLDRAFRLATLEPVGPVHLAIPNDFFKTEIPITFDMQSTLPQQIRIDSAADDEVSLQAAHNRLMNSSAPLCLIGEGAVRIGAEHAVIEFCETWNIPFVTAANAKGIASREHALNFGTGSPYMEAILGHPALQEIYSPVDMLICIGYQYVDDLLPKMWEHGPEKSIVAISAYSQRQIDAKFSPEVECVGDISKTLARLTGRGVRPMTSRRLEHMNALYDDIVAAQQEVDGTLTPIQVIDSINRHLDGGVFCTDIGYYRHHAILFSQPSTVGRFFTDAGLSSFGSGLPAAMAAQLERPDLPVFLLCGDGGFHSGSGDLETLVRYRLPVVVIVMNNSAFELIGLYQRRHNQTPNLSITRLGTVDFVKLAEANGCRGVRAASQAALDQAIAARDRSQPLLIEVSMEYRDREFFRESF